MKNVFRVEIEVMVGEFLDHRSVEELLKFLANAEVPLLQGVRGGHHLDGKVDVIILHQLGLKEIIKNVTRKPEMIHYERVRNEKKVHVLAVDLLHRNPYEEPLIPHLQRRVIS